MEQAAQVLLEQAPVGVVHSLKARFYSQIIHKNTHLHFRKKPIIL